ncbi:hypothetical protein HOY80DRAFT_1102890, partial [Tuber brumale]
LYRNTSLHLQDIAAQVGTTIGTFIMRGINITEATAIPSPIRLDDLGAEFNTKRQHIPDAPGRVRVVSFTVKQLKGQKGEISKGRFGLLSFCAEESIVQIGIGCLHRVRYRSFRLEGTTIAEHYSFQLSIELTYSKVPTAETRSAEWYPHELSLVQN